MQKEISVAAWVLSLSGQIIRKIVIMLINSDTSDKLTQLQFNSSHLKQSCFFFLGFTILFLGKLLMRKFSYCWAENSFD